MKYHIYALKREPLPASGVLNEILKRQAQIFHISKGFSLFAVVQHGSPSTGSRHSRVYFAERCWLTLISGLFEKERMKNNYDKMEIRKF